jgi:hypothetical protein
MPDSWIEPFPQGLGNNVPNFCLRILPAVLASTRTGDFKKDEAEDFRGVIADSDLFRLGDVAVALWERLTGWRPEPTLPRSPRQYNIMFFLFGARAPAAPLPLQSRL